MMVVVLFLLHALGVTYSTESARVLSPLALLALRFSMRKVWQGEHRAALLGNSFSQVQSIACPSEWQTFGCFSTL